MTRATDAAGGRGKTRRAVLLTIMALGTVVTLTAVNGVFAIFTDRATTGTNTASSRAEARSADLQISTATFDSQSHAITCGTFDEDLVTGIITVSDLTPGGSDFGVGNLCLKNVGSRTLDISSSAIDLVDTDHACTGDEASVDATCGGDGLGELSAELTVEFIRSTCVAPLNLLGDDDLGNLTSTPFSLGSIAPDEVACFRIGVIDLAQTTGDMITITQSDTSTWRFAFDGTAA